MPYGAKALGFALQVSSPTCRSPEQLHTFARLPRAVSSPTFSISKSEGFATSLANLLRLPGS